MIAACYTTDLYCDCAQCEASGYPVKAEYTGETWASTAKQAQKDGWVISPDRTKCWAPESAH